MSDPHELAGIAAERILGLIPPESTEFRWPPTQAERSALLGLGWRWMEWLRENADEIGSGPIEDLIDRLSAAAFRERQVAERMERDPLAHL